MRIRGWMGNGRQGVELSIYDEESETDDDAWMDKRGVMVDE